MPKNNFPKNLELKESDCWPRCKPRSLHCTLLPQKKYFFCSRCFRRIQCNHTHSLHLYPSLTHTHLLKSMMSWSNSDIFCGPLDGDKVRRIFSWQAENRGRFSADFPPFFPPFLPPSLTFRPEVVRIFQTPIYLECTSSVISGHSLFGTSRSHTSSWVAL